MTQALEIGASLTFDTPKGERLTGEIIGRDWSFSFLLAYYVRTPDGLRYRVNLCHQSGHPY